jgi:hypothetical protein
MGKIIGGLIIGALGFLIIWKTSWIVQNFGTNSWAEAKLGSSGGTRLMYKLIGLIIMLYAMLMITGLSDNFMMATIGKIFTAGSR